MFPYINAQYNMKVLITMALAVVSIFVNGQSYPEYFTLKQSNRTRKIECSPGNYLVFELPTTTDTSIRAFDYYRGKILKITTDSITMQPTEIQYQIQSKDSSTFSTQRTFHQNAPVIRFSKDQVGKIFYESRKNDNWKSIGISSMILGCLTSLILAPLISINYSTGKVNSTTYITTASIGLTFVSVGIPLTVVNKEKKYHMKEALKGKKVPVWRFE